MTKQITQTLITLVCLTGASDLLALGNSDVNVRLLSGYYWMDNSCTAAGPQGKVVSFRVVNTKGSALYGVTLTLGTLTFVPVAPTTYSSGTPSFTCRTSTSVYIGDIAAGDSATAFFYVGYNCLIYPNNTNLTTDYLTHAVTVSDNQSGVVSQTFNSRIYVLRNSNNNTITIIASSLNTIGTLATLTVAYNISNVKPGNIIDMEISTLPTFPAGYEIVGCRYTASTITADFPVGLKNTHYSNSILSNLPSGGTVTIEWTLKITGTYTGLTSSNLVPYVVSDAGSAQRWQANVTAFTGTATPTNPLSITKKVNNMNVLTSDTVEYTIVIRNSSTVADVTLDKIIDNLPRDYQFRYMESNNLIYPKLVTYDNCTQYPLFNDTNYLNFIGHKPLGGGAFSWVIPKQDSIKLIYSAVVSGTPGLNDTNFVSMYVGNFNAGTAFAKVNVYSFLPVRVLYFKGEHSGDEVNLNWALESDVPCSRFELSRFDALADDYAPVTDLPGCSSAFEYSASDPHGSISGKHLVSYRLRIYMPEGDSKEIFTDVTLNQNLNAFRVVGTDGNLLELHAVNSALKQIELRVFDLSGRELHSEALFSEDGVFRTRIQSGLHQGQFLLLSVHTGSGSWQQKYICR